MSFSLFSLSTMSQHVTTSLDIKAGHPEQDFYRRRVKWEALL
jgi:hypothetical protein